MGMQGFSISPDAMRMLYEAAGAGDRAAVSELHRMEDIALKQRAANMQAQEANAKYAYMDEGVNAAPRLDIEKMYNLSATNSQGRSPNSVPNEAAIGTAAPVYQKIEAPMVNQARTNNPAPGSFRYAREYDAYQEPPVSAVQPIAEIPSAYPGTTTQARQPAGGSVQDYLAQLRGGSRAQPKYEPGMTSPYANQQLEEAAKSRVAAEALKTKLGFQGEQADKRNAQQIEADKRKYKQQMDMFDKMQSLKERLAKSYAGKSMSTADKAALAGFNALQAKYKNAINSILIPEDQQKKDAAELMRLQKMLGIAPGQEAHNTSKQEAPAKEISKKFQNANGDIKVEYTDGTTEIIKGK